MNIRIYPSVLQGRVKAPPSKSEAHRLLLCAGLAEGRSVISGIGYSADVIATREVLRVLGCTVTQVNEDVIIERKETIAPYAVDEKGIASQNIVDCKESGSTLRFILPILGALHIQARIVGQGRLSDRPYSELATELIAHGMKFSRINGLPLEVEGQLTSGIYSLPGDVSSQFITGLLLALPLLQGNSDIKLRSPLQSKPYVDMTIQVLQRFGIVIEESLEGYHIVGGQKYQAGNHIVEGDYSGSAFFLAANALGANIEISGLNPNSVQGDRQFTRILQEIGLLQMTDINDENHREVLKSHSNRKHVCDIVSCPFNTNMYDKCAQEEAKIKGIAANKRASNMMQESNCENGVNFATCRISTTQVPDLFPILAVVLAKQSRISEIYGAARLRLKESDRLNAMAECLTRLNVVTIVGEDNLTIVGTGHLTGGRVRSFNDHRIGMAMAIAGCYADAPIIIENATVVDKSYPNFFDVLLSVGGRFEWLEEIEK